VLDDFLHPESAAALVQPGLDYVVDCIDSIAPKQQLISAALQRGIRVVSSMGAGGRMDPSRVQVGSWGRAQAGGGPPLRLAAARRRERGRGLDRGRSAEGGAWGACADVRLPAKQHSSAAAGRGRAGP
jgi:hypothetical protein